MNYKRLFQSMVYSFLLVTAFVGVIGFISLCIYLGVFYPYILGLIVLFLFFLVLTYGFYVTPDRSDKPATFDDELKDVQRHYRNRSKE